MLDLKLRREEFREKYFYPQYSGKLHLAFTIFMCLAAVIVALILLNGFKPIYFLWLIFFFLFNSFLEYLSHRYHQHQKIPF